MCTDAKESCCYTAGDINRTGMIKAKRKPKIREENGLLWQPHNPKEGSWPYISSQNPHFWRPKGILQLKIHSWLRVLWLVSREDGGDSLMGD